MCSSRVSIVIASNEIHLIRFCVLKSYRNTNKLSSVALDNAQSSSSTCSITTITTQTLRDFSLESEKSNFLF